MKKFLTIFTIAMMATLMFASCSSGDDGPTTQDTASILGDWKVTSAQGYYDFGMSAPVEFNVTFNKDFENYEGTTDYYAYLEFCACFKFYNGGKMDILWGKWNADLNDYYWNDEGGEDAIYILKGNQITIQCADYNEATAEEYGCFKNTYTIKHKDGKTMELYVEKDGQWVSLTLRKY